MITLVWGLLLFRRRFHLAIHDASKPCQWICSEAHLHLGMYTLSHCDLCMVKQQGGRVGVISVDQDLNSVCGHVATVARGAEWLE